MKIQFSPQFLAKIRGEQSFNSPIGEAAAQYVGLGNRQTPVEKLGHKAVSVLRSIPQDIARSGAATVQSLAGQNVSDFTPTGRAQQALYGTEPIKPVQRSNATQNIEKAGFSPKVSKVLGAGAFVASTGANFLGGGAEKKAAEQTAVDVAKSPGVGKRIVQALRNITDPFTENSKVIKSLGTTGKRLASTIKDTYASAEVQAGKAFSSVVRPLQKLTPAEQKNFIEHVQGQAEPLNAKVAQIAQVYDKFRKDVAAKADELGLFPHGSRADYFPRQLNEKFIANPKNETAIVNHLVQTGQAPDIGAARTMYQNLKQTTEGAGQYFESGGRLLKQQGNLEYSRNLNLPAEAYNNDPVSALTQYFSKAYKRINEAQNFGVNGEKVPDYLNQITAEGGNAAKAEKALRQILEPSGEGIIPKALSNFAREVTSATKLTTSFISNAAQPVNTITSKGLGNTLRAVGRMLISPDEAITKALESGSLNDDLLKEATGSKYKTWVSKLPWIKTFGKVEEFNRILEANASEFGVNSMVNRLLKNPKSPLARRFLERQYGLNPDKIIEQGGLEGDELLKAINEGVNRSQFRVRPQDLPSVLNGADAKLFGQFKSFAFKQAQFVMDEVVKEAGKGNVAPLLRYLIAGTAIGEGVNYAKPRVAHPIQALRGETPERPSGGKRIVSDLTAVGGAGILGDATNKILSGKQSLYEWVFGPSVSSAFDLATNIGKATGLSKSYGKPVPANAVPLEKQALQQIPFVGSDFSSELSSPSSSSSTKRRSSSTTITSPKRRK